MMTTEPLTNTELAERRVQQLAAALDYWRERAEAAEAKLAAPLLALFAEEAARAEAAEAKLADLEAQLAAQQWRPVTEKPPEPPDGETSEYLTWNDLTGFTVRRYRDGQFHSAFRKQPTHWRPLPPAPDLEAQLAAQQWRPIPPTASETTQ